MSSHYPPSPRNVPWELWQPSASYVSSLNRMLTGVIVFFTIYFTLAALFLALAVGLLRMTRFATSGVGVLFCVVLAFIPGGVFLFLVKNLFKVRRPGKTYDIEVLPEDHPRLFQFLHAVSKETQSPFPKHVYVNFEVNAAAMQAVGFRYLFSRPERSLKLGLGLLNVINLTEFKALIAHEFGHMTQNDMKSGTWVCMASKIMDNMLNQRDAFDEFLFNNQYLAWIYTSLTTFLCAVFALVMKLDSALSREMEFHADSIAVSVAGSDAVASLLYRSLWGDWCLNQLVNDLHAAREKNLHSADIFAHHLETAKFLRKKHYDPELGELPALPPNAQETIQIFDPEEDDEQAAMWASHPPNHDRELAAKEFYIRSVYDVRSPWILFDQIPELRKAVSKTFYREVYQHKKKLELADPKKIQEFLNEEYADYAYDAKYAGLYDDRSIEKFDMGLIWKRAEKSRNRPEALMKALGALTAPEVAAFSRRFQRHLLEEEFLEALANKRIKLKKKKFEFRGQKYPKKDAKKFLFGVSEEVKCDQAWLKEYDARVYTVHLELALYLNPAWAQELRTRYRFHFVEQSLWKTMRERQGDIQFVLEFLSQNQEELPEEIFVQILEIFREGHQAIRNVLEEGENQQFPPLRGLPAGISLRAYLLPTPLVDRPTEWDYRIKGKWVDKFLDQYREVQRKLFSLHFKSMAAILTLQEQIAKAAQQKWAGPVEQTFKRAGK